MIYRDFAQLIKQVRETKSSKRVMAVVAAEDSHTLEAVSRAVHNDIVAPLLIGRGDVIKSQLAKMELDQAHFPIIHTESEDDAVLKAAQLVHEGQAHFIMKGLIQTPKLMRALLSEAGGFRGEGLLSHMSFAKLPNYHKLVAITDPALNIYPDLQQKRQIVLNAVETMLRMGFDTPKVAMLAGSELVNPKMPETIDAYELQKMNEAGDLPNCIVEGPLSYDLAVSKEAAQIKGIESKVCGDADLLVAPNIAVGNTLIKVLKFTAGVESAGIVVGGKAPIVLTSRATDVDSKYLPIVLAASASLGHGG